MTGPNRFLRHFTGNATTAASDTEVTSTYAPRATGDLARRLA
jgi:hypothetical protein